jgi:hypothetical protein
MARTFTAFSLGADELGIVFPLVQAVLPQLELATWRWYMQPLSEQSEPSSCGAIGLRNAAGYVCGLLTYRAERDLRCGTVLAVDLFTTLDLVSERPATFALLEAAELKARELACTRIHIHLDDAQTSIANRLGLAGYHIEAARHCRMVSPTPPTS